MYRMQEKKFSMEDTENGLTELVVSIRFDNKCT